MALRLVDEPKKKRTLQAELERNLKGALKRQGTLNIGFPGGNADEVVYSAGEGTLWVAFGPPNKDTAIPRFWNAFGVYKPERPAQTITVEINIPTDSNTGQVAGLFAEDSETRNIFLMHSGGIGGGRPGIGKSAFLVWSKAKLVDVSEPDGGVRSGIVVGSLGDMALADDVWKFVRSVQSFKDQAATGPLSDS